MGYGHGQWGNDVPHFDKEGHFRTHHGYEMRRRERMGGNFEPREERGVLGQFLLLGGILFVGVVVPVLVMEKLGRIDVQKKRNDR
jgi:hypothetical protein